MVVYSNHHLAGVLLIRLVFLPVLNSSNGRFIEWINFLRWGSFTLFVYLVSFTSETIA